ncbi:alpha/beta fold hydrolase [Streptomyces asoensis]|uniref:Alpha/beta hydrolase n=1 Tax=Streptomyces asoensis TaxID=249586 RepID=A0ABQ3S5C5_9ACTN|nr:alpha/beta fold hydrolase [Streptomyces asoensis]GGQ64633.1 alpha/beta hydrolase [Streptomyces asoensis]GHI63323.1 alpha/beta hydrolase [Streptomyces asoensis]
MTTEPTLTESGPATGRPVLVLHGGGGPLTVAPLAAHLAAHAHTLLPTHPGWNGTPRPAGLTRVADLAAAYLRLLRDRDLSDVLVVGSSLGGWIAAELAAADTEGRISGVVLLDAVGIDVEGEPVRDFIALDARGVAEYAYHDPERFYVDPATLPAERLAAIQANMATLRVFSGGPAMSDPGLRARLADITVPTLVLWGESDRICTPAYGKEYAASLGNGRFAVVAEAGHLPHLEQPARTLALVDAFAAETARR